MNIKQLSEVIVGVGYGAEVIGKETRMSVSGEGKPYVVTVCRSSKLWEEIRSLPGKTHDEFAGAKLIEEMIYDAIKEQGYVPSEELCEE